MKPIKATDGTYAELVAQKGYTLVFIDTRVHGYRDEARIRAYIRKLAREQADWLRVILVFKEDCPTTTAGVVPATFRLYFDGGSLSGFQAGNHHAVRSWLSGWCPRLAPNSQEK